MRYVMSDLHGCRFAYTAMLDLVGFGPEDTLYILGDVVDRGPDPVGILLDMFERPNVVPLLGNHEYMAYSVLSQLEPGMTERDFYTALDAKGFANYHLWMMNGGKSTLHLYLRLSSEQRHRVLGYLEGFKQYEVAEAGGKVFFMVHAGLGHFSEEKALSDYTIDELVWERPDYSRIYFEDAVLVTGHTPTASFAEPDRVFLGNGHLAIDCGCVFNGTLGAVCLETLEEFYVKWK